MEIGAIMDKTIEEIILYRIMEAKSIETEVQVKIMVDLGKDTGATHGADLVLEMDTVIIGDMKAEVDKDLVLMTGKVIGQGLDQVHVSTNRDRLRCYRCSEYDHFAIECPNALTDESSDESEGATL